MPVRYPLLELATTPIWQGNLCELKCVDVIPETHDVTTFYFKPRRIKGALFSYYPGQFITFQLLIGGKRVNRTYTLSSTPTRPYTVSVTIKRIPNGLVSNWMHENMKKGSLVEALGPSGSFSFVKTPSWNKKYLFLSGGSGITPMLSMSRCLTDLKINADIAFVHHARSEKDLIAKEEVSNLSYNNKKFSPTYICDVGSEQWAGPTGYFTGEKLETIVPDFKEREVFVCGPPPYMELVKKTLIERGFDMDRFHSESFNFFELKEATAVVKTQPGIQPEPLEDKATQGDFIIELRRSGKIQRFSIPKTKSILQALKDQGIVLPFGCQEGICGTCKALKTRGSVEMQSQGGILKREEEAGYILLCCSYPRSDLSIDLSGGTAQ